MNRVDRLEAQRNRNVEKYAALQRNSMQKNQTIALLERNAAATAIVTAQMNERMRHMQTRVNAIPRARWAIFRGCVTGLALVQLLANFINPDMTRAQFQAGASMALGTVLQSGRGFVVDRMQHTGGLRNNSVQFAW